jgi:hypothetical protein
MHHHVRLQRAHEKQCRGSRVAAPDHAGIHGTTEVVADDRQAASRRAVGSIGVERYDQRSCPLVDVNRDVFGNDLFRERNELLRDPAQYDPRIGSRVDVGELQDAIRRLRHPAAHREAEELLFRVDVTQHSGRRHA